VLVKPNLISIFKMLETEFEVIVNFRVWAKIINCIKVTIDDSTGEQKDLILFLTSKAELVLVEFGVKDIHHVSKTIIKCPENDLISLKNPPLF